MVYHIGDIMREKYTFNVDFKNTNDTLVQYSDIDWIGSGTKPTESQVNAWVAEKNDVLTLAELRKLRNKKLSETDWTRSDDVPSETKSKWTSYRQALRDLPADASKRSINANGDVTITWPTEPS